MCRLSFLYVCLEWSKDMIGQELLQQYYKPEDIRMTRPFQRYLCNFTTPFKLQNLETIKPSG